MFSLRLQIFSVQEGLLCLNTANTHTVYDMLACMSCLPQGWLLSYCGRWIKRFSQT